MSPNDDIFLKRLYAAFDVDNKKTLDFEYVFFKTKYSMKRIN